MYGLSQDIRHSYVRPSRCHDDGGDVRSVNTFYIITLSRPKFNGALSDRHLF